MTRDTQTDRPTLVLGGTGKTGRRVAARLAAQGFSVRVGSRSGQPPFDWEDPTPGRRSCSWRSESMPPSPSPSARRSSLRSSCACPKQPHQSRAPNRPA